MFKVILALLLMSSVFSQDFSKVKIEREKLTNNLHVLRGMGGNIGVLSGPDGVFLVDDQFAPLADKIRAAVKLISSSPIKYVFNTHWHFDHTGGNESFGKSGSVIVAHENVRKLLSKDQFIKTFGREIKAKPKEGLPVITFNSRINFHINDEDVNVFHVKNAHTNGDSIIHFKKANVFHMGDTLFFDRFPFIDIQHGGSLDGMIKAHETVISKSNKNSRYIPGHGKVATYAGLKAYVADLKKIRSILKKVKRKGLSLDKAKDKNPLAEFDKKGWGNYFIKTGKFMDIVYPTL